MADDTRWKAATKVFKAKKKEGQKNIERDPLAKMGRVHVQQQDINTLQLRNKGLLKKRTKKAEDGEAEADAEPKKLKKTGLDGEKKSGSKKLKTE